MSGLATDALHVVSHVAHAALLGAAMPALAQALWIVGAVTLSVAIRRAASWALVVSLSIVDAHGFGPSWRSAARAMFTSA